MAIAFRAAATALNVGPSCNKPTGTLQNDVMVALVLTYDNASETYTPPSGWTILGTQQVESASGDITVSAAYYKVAGASEPSSYTWTISPAAYTDIAIVSYSGVDTTTPVDTSSANHGFTGTRTGTGITTAAANEMVLWLSAGYGQVLNAGGPTGFTNRATWDGVNEIWEKSFASAGATGNITATQGGTDSWTAHVVALNPAGGAAAVSPVTPELVRSFAFAPKPKPVLKKPVASIPLAAFATQPPSGAISTQAGLGIGVNAAAVTVQTAYTITCQAGLGIGVNAPTTTLQTAYTVAPAAGVGIGVNAPTTTLATAYTISPSAGLGIGVLASTTVQTAYAIAASAGLGIGILTNTNVATAYAIGAQAGLGIGVLTNLTLNGGSQITTQAGVGIGVAPNTTLPTAYAILCNAGLGIGVAQGITLKTAQTISASPGVGIGVAGSLSLLTAYRMGLQAGLGVGVVFNMLVSLITAQPFQVTPGDSLTSVGPNAYTEATRAPSAYGGASRAPDAHSESTLKPDGYTGVSRAPDAYTGVRR